VVLNRALSAGALAGALSGIVAVLVFVAASVLHPDVGAGNTDDLAGTAILYLVFALVLGAAAGAVLALPVGAVLAALHKHLTNRFLARLATAILVLAVVLALASLLSALGTAPGYLQLLIGPTAVVAPMVGAWRAPKVLGLPEPEPEEPEFDAVPPSPNPGRHRRRRR
jgi:hypothetical protein